ncbi:hypothetical protein AYWB_523 [Aster yellows witches'-broom phytoplasma AYWB]|uniref:Uncharacterized protein n=1 Tax=Aster yellows witches'-broom phytoplasma (strain AYWB) TaxID=322098 RepID=Q2NIV3_AYWBP|nr:hypothetical protein AYWB_523 [Aster yellows witches'-broom phytoplasma AYWB]
MNKYLFFKNHFIWLNHNYNCNQLFKITLKNFLQTLKLKLKKERGRTWLKES